MGYNITYKSSVRKDLKKINKADARRILDQLEKDLARRPGDYPALKGEFTGLRNYRAGDYRAIFAIIEDDVIVLRIGNRNDVYR